MDRTSSLQGMALLRGAVSLALAALPSAAYGQVSAGGQDLDEIVVTSHFREERAQTIGASIVAFGDDELQARGIVDFDDLASSVPGLSVRDSGPHQNDIAIRGVSRATFGYVSAGTNSLVSFYLDEVPVTSLSDRQRDVSPFDLTRVEILKGPQPTFYGEGAVAGVVRYFSNEPDLDEVSGSAGGSFATVNEGDPSYHVDAALNVPIIQDKLGLRVSGFYRREGGFIDNVFLDERDVNSWESYGGKVTLLFKPSDAVDIKLFYHRVSDDIDDEFNVDGQFPDRDHLVNTNPADSFTEDDFELMGARLQVRTDIGTLTSITGLQHRDIDFRRFDPLNQAFNDILGLPPRTIIAVNQGRQHERYFTQELQFASSFGGPIEMTAGLFYRDLRFAMPDTLIDASGRLAAILGTNTILSLPGGSDPHHQLSGFVELDYDVTDQLKLIAGARYVHDKRVMTIDANTAALVPFQLPAGRTYRFKLNRLLPKAAVEFRPTRDLLAYASFARGVRIGGLNSPISASYAASVDTRSFDELLDYAPDQVDAYEFGAKSVWLSGRLVLNAALFRNEIKHQQVLETNPFAFIDNAPKARVQGVEVETSLRLGAHLSLSGSLAYTDAEYRADSPRPGQHIRAGNPLPGIPKWEGALGLYGSWPVFGGDWTAIGGASFAYTGHRIFDVTGSRFRRMNSLELVNLRAGIANDRFTITGFVRNLFNDVEALAVQEYGLDSAGNLPAIASNPNRPRTIGVSLATYF